jgi:hypothetical protein
VPKIKERKNRHVHSPIRFHSLLFIKRGENFALLYLNTHPVGYFYEEQQHLHNFLLTGVAYMGRKKWRNVNRVCGIMKRNEIASRYEEHL